MADIYRDDLAGEDLFRQNALERLVSGIRDAVEDRKRERQVQDVISAAPEMTTADWKEQQRKRRRNALSYNIPGYSESNPYARGNKLEDVSSNIILPLIAAAEVIGTKGRTGGEAAMLAQQNIEAGKAARAQQAGEYEKILDEREKRAAFREATPETIQDVIKEYYPEDYAKSLLRRQYMTGRTVLPESVDGILAVLEDDPNFGPTEENPEGSISYQLFLKAKNDPALNKSLIEDISDINKAYALIGRDVKRLDELLPGKVRERRETSKASAGGKIEGEAEGADVAAETAAKIAEKRAAGAKIGALRAAYEQAAQGLYDLTGGEAESAAIAVDSIDAMNWFKNALINGEISFLDITPAGVFTNPEAQTMQNTIEDMYARPLSGAAINEKEWKKFKAEVGTGFFNLATEKGRKAAINRLDQLINRNLRANALVLKDDDWYTRVKSITFEQEPGPLTPEEEAELKQLEKEAAEGLF